MHEIEPVKAPVSRVAGDVVQAAVSLSAPIAAVASGGSPRPMPADLLTTHPVTEERPRSLDEIWTSFRSAVRSKVQPEQFEAWFRRAALVSVDDQVMRLAVQNNFAREWLENYYREKLEAAAREVLKGARRIEISVDPELCSSAGAERASLDAGSSASSGDSSSARSGESLGAPNAASSDAARENDGSTRGELGEDDFGARDMRPTSGRRSSTGRDGASTRRTHQRSHDERRDDALDPRRPSRQSPSASSANGASFGNAASASSGDGNALLWKSEIGLNPKYTFDNFVVGPCNRFAHAAAVGAAEAPGRNYNPFFLHGSVGLGKTHLLQSLCFALLVRNPQTRIQYLSCETFVNHFISALENGNVQKFRNKYRNVDVLVVDDIHVLANKDRTQEEFFHTFNTLYQSGKQIVLSSDSPPKDIPTLQERLVSRFKWGLVTEIEPPCFETRMAILKRKSRERGRELPDDVACLLAERIDSNIRELEGAVTKLLGFAGVTCSQVSCDLAREALRDIFETRKGQPSMEDILTAVCEHFDVKISELQSKKRTNAIAYPRQIAMYLARQITRHSLEEIGGFFGGRDHSTVIYAIEKVTQMLVEDGEARGIVDGFLARLQGPGG
jgi:chromosomal replication initiator protein